MKIRYWLAVLTGAAATLHTASAADITGTVTIKGTPPKEAEYTPIENDPICSKLHNGKVFTHFYVVGPDNGLGDVIVMLKNVTGKSTGASAPPAELDQKGCLYEPQILAIQTHQKLVIKNSDPALHNVHIVPKVAANEQALEQAGTVNIAQMAGSPPLTITFPAAENFLQFNCDVHQWMHAWVTVVDNPYFAVTKKDGSFTIKDVPPGKYTIAALHRKLAPDGVDKEVEVKEGQPTKVDFTIEVK